VINSSHGCITQPTPRSQNLTIKPSKTSIPDPATKSPTQHTAVSHRRTGETKTTSTENKKEPSFLAQITVPSDSSDPSYPLPYSHTKKYPPKKYPDLQEKYRRESSRNIKIA
jgi:hypothetical protein